MKFLKVDNKIPKKYLKQKSCLEQIYIINTTCKRAQNGKKMNANFIKLSLRLIRSQA